VSTSSLFTKKLKHCLINNKLCYTCFKGYPLGLTLSVCETKEQCAANEGDECAWYPGEFVNATEPLRIYCAHDVTGKYLRLRQKTTIKFYFAFCELSAFSKI